ncbi:MAG TPA: hypothetical protein VNA12_02250 [Mycobacteriales bacterium]|nr:hypothetical protein [Mycobacteriales bacterium]
MRTAARLTAAVLAACLAAGGALGGCASGDDDAPVVAVTLPPGSLAAQVLQPDDVPDGLVPLLAQTGKADISRIAGFSSDSTAAEASLREHGFDEAYVVQYGDPKSGRYIVNVVAKFDTVDGATEDLTADLESARATGTPFPVTGLGDQAGGVRAGTASPSASPAPDDLVTVRWRVGATTWLLAVGAPGTVEQDAVVQLAQIVLKRATDEKK